MTRANAEASGSKPYEIPSVFAAPIPSTTRPAPRTVTPVPPPTAVTSTGGWSSGAPRALPLAASRTRSAIPLAAEIPPPHLPVAPMLSRAPATRNTRAGSASTVCSDSVASVASSSKSKGRGKAPAKPKGTGKAPAESKGKGKAKADDSGENKVEMTVKSKDKAKAKSKVPVAEVIEVKSLEGGSDDEPVFVGAAKAKQLSAKYTMAFSREMKTASGSKLVAIGTAPKKPSSKAKKEENAAGVVLHPPKEPDPIPVWLGNPVVLKELANCPLCQQEWKRESGPARWRHISCCLPPLFRPPNPSPDLHKIIDDALEARAAKEEPTTLLDLHVARGDAQDRRSPDAAEATKPKAKPKPKAQMGAGRLRRTRVQSAADRSEGWETEVSERVSALTEPSPPKRPKRESAREGEHTFIPSSPITYTFPLTQPLGESSLAGQYVRVPFEAVIIPLSSSPLPSYPEAQAERTAPLSPQRSPSPVTFPQSPSPAIAETTSPLSPVRSLEQASLDSPTPPSPPALLSSPSPPLPPASPEQEIIPLPPASPEEETIPLPPPSQKRAGRFILEALSPADQRLLGQLAEPFRGRGSPCVDGGFSRKRGSAEFGPGAYCPKRSKVGA